MSMTTHFLNLLTVPTAVALQYLSDLSVSPDVAYLLKASKTYSGNALTIRRTSDSTETTIGFKTYTAVDGKEFEYADMTAIEDFCTGTDCFIVRAFDTTGNGRDGSNTQAAKQTKIWDTTNGLEIISNGLAGINTLDDTVLITSDGNPPYSATINVFVPSAGSTVDQGMIYSAANNFPHVQQDGSSTTGDNLANPVTHYKNGSATGLTDPSRNALYDSFATGNKNLMRVEFDENGEMGTDAGHILNYNGNISLWGFKRPANIFWYSQPLTADQIDEIEAYLNNVYDLY